MVSLKQKAFHNGSQHINNLGEKAVTPIHNSQVAVYHFHPRTLKKVSQKCFWWSVTLTVML